MTKILRISTSVNWRHIPGKMTPADHGPRILTPSDIPTLWLEPPDFLSTPYGSWNYAAENRNHICATQATQLQTPFIEVKNFLTWSRQLNSARMVFRAIRRFKTKPGKRKQNESTETSSTDVFASDENKAKNYLITMSQNEFFSGTISSLLKSSNLEKGDKLMPFTISLDDDGLLKMGGILNKAPLTYITKHPLVLHSMSRVARRLIEKVHHAFGHQGGEYVNFPNDWIEKRAEKSGKNCFICKRWRADNMRPKMADLPEIRFQMYTSCTLSSV